MRINSERKKHYWTQRAQELQKSKVTTPQSVDEVFEEVYTETEPTSIVRDQPIEDMALESIEISQEPVLSRKYYPTSIPDETIDEIKRINQIVYISNAFIHRLEENPDLIELLLSGKLNKDQVDLLGWSIPISWLPDNIEDLVVYKYLDLSPTVKQLLHILAIQEEIEPIDDTYTSTYYDIKKGFELVENQAKVESLIPGVYIELKPEILTKIPIYGSAIVHFKRSGKRTKHYRGSDYIIGDLSKEDTVIEISYRRLRLLDEESAEKIKDLKVKVSKDEKTPDFGFVEEAAIPFQNNRYKNIKYNHLIYLIENSSIDKETQDRLLYIIKNNYYDNEWGYSLNAPNEIILKITELGTQEIERLTKEFEEKTEEYQTRPIEQPEFNARYYIEERIDDLEHVRVKELVLLIKDSPDEYVEALLADPIIQEKLELPAQMSPEETKRLIRLINLRLSKTTIDFINNLGFDYNSFLINPENNYMTSYNINPIISLYGVFDYPYEMAEISIADILGHDGSKYGGYKGKSILYTFENFFEKDGDGYHNRSLGLLEYKTGAELLEALKRRNNDTQDMRLREYDGGRYIVSGNGLHRYTVLRFHYLLDRMKGDKTEEELREMYTIPVTVDSVVNTKKTYCNYLICQAHEEINFISFDAKKDTIKIHYHEGSPKEINEDELINLAIDSLDQLYDQKLRQVKEYYDTIESFRKFIDIIKPNYFQVAEEKEEAAKTWQS